MIIFRASRMYFANEGMSRNYDLFVCILGHNARISKARIFANYSNRPHCQLALFCDRVRHRQPHIVHEA